MAGKDRIHAAPCLPVSSYVRLPAGFASDGYAAAFRDKESRHGGNRSGRNFGGEAGL